MSKFFIILFILFLILSTAIVKNSTKRIDDETFVLRENFPSRSAKLRYVIKKDNSYNFNTDILEKFDYLIKIEDFGNKLWRNF